MKSGLGRITENTSTYQGVIVYSMNDLPLVSINIKLNYLSYPLISNIFSSFDQFAFTR